MQSVGRRPGRSRSAQQTAIGRYEILERIGFGGMAEVYKARLRTDRGAEKIVAVKKILPQWADDDQLRNMFLHEVKVAFSLSHKNIVSVFDQGEADGYHYLVMDYVEGKDLGQVLRALGHLRNRIPEPLAVFIVAEIAAALEYAHTKQDRMGRRLNIIHRDVSPSNIYISCEGEAKLGDFGIAKIAVNPQTSVHILKGKWSYMSPEQARGEDIDHRSDLYSLGLVFYELLCGRKCFSDENEMKILEKARRADLPNFKESGIPEGLLPIVSKALEANPEERYASAAGLEDELRRFLHRFGSERWERRLGAVVSELFPAQAQTGSKDDEQEETEEKQTKVIPGAESPSPRPWRTPVFVAAGALLGISTAVAALRLFREQEIQTVVVAPQKSPSAAAEPSAPHPPSLAPDSTTPATASSAGSKTVPAAVGTSLHTQAEPAAHGFLNLSSTPWANVTIDGRPVDATTPLIHYKLAAGRHEIQLSNPYTPMKKSLKVDIREGETQNLVVDLQLNR
ncbi:MAG: protein kinase [Nitrospirae bacterium]|nr:protein kinase [Nitrospirota bacterium]